MSRLRVCLVSLACLIVALTLSSDAMAGRPLLGRFKSQASTSSQTVTSTATVSSVTTTAATSSSSTAQAKANRLASLGRLSHVGPLAGRYEGVGFSSRSREDAIRSCCYWGQRTPTDIGAARGPSGWFAVVGYR